MKKGRIFLILIGIILCVMVVLTIINSLNKKESAETTEIVPGEEITEEQERQTIISLYYTNIETNTLVPEAKVIDAKDLLENPYKTITEFLIESPKNDKLKSSIPEGTKVNSATKNLDTVVLDLSKEFIENQNADIIKLAIMSIVNALTELNDVNSVKILIDGEENKTIDGTDITFSENFVRTSI